MVKSINKLIKDEKIKKERQKKAKAQKRKEKAMLNVNTDIQDNTDVIKAKTDGNQ